MAHLERILVYPIKSLDSVWVEQAEFVTSGGLEWDRRFAIVDDAGGYVNGKRDATIHRIRVEYDLEPGTITISAAAPDGSGRGRSIDEQTFHLEVDRRAIEELLTDFFGYPVQLVRDDAGGFPDDTDAAGPTVISTATLDAVAGWFDDVDASEMCRRLRPNLVVGDVEAFWEDHLFDVPGRVVPFDVGDVRIHGVNPCQRCVVPSRDPDTGESIEGFRETFVEHRKATLPEWANEEWFDHYFRVMVNTRVPESSWGERIEVGETVTVSEPISSTSNGP